MKTSVLSLRKIHNVERQLSSHQDEMIEIIKEDDFTSVKIEANTFMTFRNFYEYYIDDQALIKIIGDKYWNINVNPNLDNVGLFDTHVGILGSFGAFWDYINVMQLTLKSPTISEITDLIKKYSRKNSYLRKKINDKTFLESIIDDIKENPVLMYSCQDCGDSGCGGIELSIHRTGEHIFWTDDEEIHIKFDFNQYKRALLNCL